MGVQNEIIDLTAVNGINISTQSDSLVVYEPQQLRADSVRYMAKKKKIF